MTLVLVAPTRGRGRAGAARPGSSPASAATAAGPVAPVLPRALAVSRVVAGAAVGLGLAAPALGRVGERAQQALVLGALAAGMPHGAADTELLRDLSTEPSAEPTAEPTTAARGRERARYAALLVGYAGAAALATAVVRRGGPGVGRAVLVGSALHFAEGELAAWGREPLPGETPGLRRARQALRAVAAGATTVALPAAVVGAQRGAAVARGEAGPVAGVPGPVAAQRSALALGRAGWTGASGRGLRRWGAVAGAATVGLALLGDRAAAGDTALLTALDLATPPPLTFAAYFGGWHALRHTARVADALAARGQLPPSRGLGDAVVQLGRKSAWAAGVGAVVAGALAVRDPRHASDRALAAVLGLTLPHAATVAADLARR